VTAAVRNPFRAPTSSDASHLDATHVSCGACDNVTRIDQTLDVAAWTCSWCGDDPEEGPAPVWEHHSPVPLGFRDDKACHWTAFTLGDLVIPEAWIYYATAPTP